MICTKINDHIFESKECVDKGRVVKSNDDRNYIATGL